MKFSFLDRDIHQLNRKALAAVRWRHLSYIMQGSMNVLNPVRRIRHSFFDFAFAHIGRPRPEFLELSRSTCGGFISSLRSSTPTRTSSPAACASA